MCHKNMNDGLHTLLYYIGMPNFIQIRLSYVILIFKMASMESPVLGLITSLIQENLNLFANAYFNEISNLRPRYYYFRTAEIARAGGRYAVQCYSRSSISVTIESPCDFLLVSDINLILSRTVLSSVCPSVHHTRDPLHDSPDPAENS